MTVLAIPMTEERLEQLKHLAARQETTPEELARSKLEEWLSQPIDAFQQAATHVLQKNAELYRRLAK